MLDVIRQAGSRITLSLFRCNDDEVFAELTAAVASRRRRRGARHVARQGRQEEAREAVERARGDRRVAVKPYTDPVVKYHAKYLVADDGPAIVASLNFTKKCFRKTCDALVVTYDPAVVSGLRRLWTADCARLPMPDDLSRAADRRTRARAPSVHRADRERAHEHPADRRQALGSRSRRAAEREAGARADGRGVLGQASRRAEIARQDHAHRRRDGRRRQPGAGGAQPRLPARGRDRRRRAVGGGRGGGAVPGGWRPRPRTRARGGGDRRSACADRACC